MRIVFSNDDYLVFEWPMNWHGANQQGHMCYEVLDKTLGKEFYLQDEEAWMLQTILNHAQDVQEMLDNLEPKLLVKFDIH